MPDTASATAELMVSVIISTPSRSYHSGRGSPRVGFVLVIGNHQFSLEWRLLVLDGKSSTAIRAAAFKTRSAQVLEDTGHVT